jgi:hypothetical protein
VKKTVCFISQKEKKMNQVWQDTRGSGRKVLQFLTPKEATNVAQTGKQQSHLTRCVYKSVFQQNQHIVVPRYMKIVNTMSKYRYMIVYILFLMASFNHMFWCTTLNIFPLVYFCLMVIICHDFLNNHILVLGCGTLVLYTSIMFYLLPIDCILKYNWTILLISMILIACMQVLLKQWNIFTINIGLIITSVLGFFSELYGRICLICVLAVTLWLFGNEVKSQFPNVSRIYYQQTIVDKQNEMYRLWNQFCQQ